MCKLRPREVKRMSSLWSYSKLVTELGPVCTGCWPQALSTRLISSFQALHYPFEEFTFSSMQGLLQSNNSLSSCRFLGQSHSFPKDIIASLFNLGPWAKLSRKTNHRTQKDRSCWSSQLEPAPLILLWASLWWSLLVFLIQASQG